MISIDLCKKVLQKDGRKYTEAELSEIRERLYTLASLEYELFTNKNREKNEKCIDLHPCEYRRAS